MNKSVYEAFKRALLEDHKRAIRKLEDKYQRNLAKLDALWNSASSNGSGIQAGHSATTKNGKTDSELVEQIVLGIKIGHEVSQPIVKEIWARRYPTRPAPERTLVSRILRRWLEANAIEPTGDSASGQVKTYAKTANIE